MKSIFFSIAVLMTLVAVPELWAQESSIYDQQVTTLWGDLFSLAKEVLLANAQGAILLLALSALFGSINFYKDIASPQVHKGHHMVQYLLIWLTANYIFALLFLFLILPDGVKLDSVDRTLFVYCILAAALPEIATNIKLSIGRTDNSLNLYQYKEQVSGLISDRVKYSSDLYQSQLSVSLSYYYYDRLEAFLDQLDMFENQVSLMPEELASLNELKSKLKTKPVEGEVQKVLKLQQQHKILGPKLLSFFDRDIRDFNNSAVAEFMKKLGPMLKINEARQLVNSGVTNSTWFLICCHLPSYRRRIANKLQIEPIRIDSIYHTSRYRMRKRISKFCLWAGSILVVLALATVLFSSMGQKQFNWGAAPIYPSGSARQVPLDQEIILESSTGTAPGNSESDIVQEEVNQ